MQLKWQNLYASLFSTEEEPSYRYPFSSLILQVHNGMQKAPRVFPHAEPLACVHHMPAHLCSHLPSVPAALFLNGPTLPGQQSFQNSSHRAGPDGSVITGYFSFDSKNICSGRQEGLLYTANIPALDVRSLKVREEKVLLFLFWWRLANPSSKTPTLFLKLLKNSKKMWFYTSKCADYSYPGGFSTHLYKVRYFYDAQLQ